MIAPSTSTQWLLLLLIPALAVFVTACDTGVDDDPEDENGFHEDAGLVEIYLDDDGERGEKVALYSDEVGWTDPDGNSIEEIEDPVVNDQGEREPLRAGGEPAVLHPVMQNNQGEVIDFYAEDVIDLDTDEPGMRQQWICGEFSSRYAPEIDQEQFDKIGFSLDEEDRVHPDAVSDSKNDQFIRRSTGEWVVMHRCDHNYIYPEEAGDVNIRFMLWHIDHSDDDTDFIRFTIEDAE